MVNSSVNFSFQLHSNLDVSGEYVRCSSTDEVIVCLHGFGVKRDARGIFTDITAMLSNSASVVLCDLSRNTNGGVEVYPLTVQIEVAEAVIEYALETFNTRQVTVIAHSFGCIVTAYLPNIQMLKRAILLAPPISNPKEALLAHFTSRDGAIDSSKPVVFSRRDGTTTTLQTAFWGALDGVDPLSGYKALAAATELSVVVAAEDELIDLKESEQMKTVGVKQYSELSSDHNFNGEGRVFLTEIIEEIIAV